MSRPEVRVVVLYEDPTTGSFMRRLVERLNLRPVRYVKCGNNDAVLKQVGREVDALRAHNYQKNLGLVVVIDGDAPQHHRRVTKLLERIARDTHDGARRDGERIALVVPTWEIENWYVHLCVPAARPIDEGKDYKPTPEWRELEKDIGAAAKRAADAWPPEPGRVDPPSLTAARDELAHVQ